MMQEPTNMFVLCAPIKVLPAGYIVHIASMPDARSAKVQGKWKKKINTYISPFAQCCR